MEFVYNQFLIARIGSSRPLSKPAHHAVVNAMAAALRKRDNPMNNDCPCGENTKAGFSAYAEWRDGEFYISVQKRGMKPYKCTGEIKGSPRPFFNTAAEWRAWARGKLEKRERFPYDRHDGAGETMLSPHDIILPVARGNPIPPAVQLAGYYLSEVWVDMKRAEYNANPNGKIEKGQITYAEQEHGRCYDNLTEDVLAVITKQKEES